MAEKYYQAVISGNTTLANKYKSEFEMIVNPVLHKSRLSQPQTRAASYEDLPSSWRIPDLYQVSQEKSY